jgi:molybdate transport system ATP-binding protein
MPAPTKPGPLRFSLAVRRGPFSLDLRLEIPEGVTVLFGPSGSGKSTLLQCLAGLLRPMDGRIELGERILFAASEGVHLPPDRRRLGYVPQDGLLFPHLSLRGNIEYGLHGTTGRGSGAGSHEGRIRDLIVALGIEHLLDRRPREVSHGEAQRAALLRALATAPDALLMDEPMSALDRELKMRALADLKGIKRSLGIPVLYVTHDPAEVLALADRVALIRAGRIQREGGPELAIEPSDGPSSSALVDNLISGRLMPRKGGREVGWGRYVLRLAVPAGSPGRNDRVALAFAPSEAIVTLEPPGVTSARNVLDATIGRIFSSGDRVLLRFDEPEPFYVAVTREARDELGLKEGRKVFLLIKSTALRPIGGSAG